MPLITQRQAIGMLRSTTGRSIEWCEATAKALATVKDGERWKIRDGQLNQTIRKENEQGPLKDSNIRPVSERKARRMQERCI